ncbi:MAG TPA: HEAT repeat domain-containing protein [Anaeromyxobacteraceae bacterium]|nr:HEAT repeat domain-containing protein [Anaeromyxobacteraceae bacterium]
MRRGGHHAALSVALLALAAAPACGRKPGLAPVGSLTVRAADLGPALAEAGLDGPLLVETAKGALAGAGFTLDEGARRSYHATFSVIAFGTSSGRDGAPAAAEAVVELELAQSWAAGPTQREAARARVPLTGGATPGPWREALRRAAKDAAEALALDLSASQKQTDALVRDLAGADPRARERAIRALGARGARGAALAVAERVRDPDPAVARAAIEALTAFKEPSSALALIEAAQAGDPMTTLRLIPVLAEIGGDDVEGYLLTLRSGHSDRAVRKAAAEALGRLHVGPPPPRSQGAKR